MKTAGALLILPKMAACLSLAFLASAASEPRNREASCPAPAFDVAPLIVAEDGRDRGYPGGLSLGDLDGDGDLDLVATRGYDPTSDAYRGDKSLAYLNRGDGRFIRLESPLADREEADSGASLADVDDDGDLDIYVSTQLGRPNRFFRNLGRGRFAAESLGDSTSDRSSDFSSQFVDVDGDNDLDLYVTGPTLERSAPSLAFRNDEGRFVAVTGTAIANGRNNPGASIWGDLDGDGDLDLFVANSDVLRLSNITPAAEIEHGLLYRNDGDWRFTRLDDQPFAGDAYPAISAAFGDVDNDGDLDLFAGSQVFNTAPRPDWLFLNDGQARFSLSPQNFPTHVQTATGAAFADFNGDGNLDLIATSYEGPIEMFVGDGTGRFARIDDPRLAPIVKGRWSVVTGDIDGDGRIDAMIGSWGETRDGDYVTVLRNRTPPCGSWTRLVLTGRYGAPDPPGTRVRFVTSSRAGTLTQTREAGAQTGFRSQSGSFFHFAIPPSHRFRRAEIRWPDGRVSHLDRVNARGTTRVAYPAE